MEVEARRVASSGDQWFSTFDQPHGVPPRRYRASDWEGERRLPRSRDCRPASVDELSVDIVEQPPTRQKADAHPGLLPRKRAERQMQSTTAACRSSSSSVSFVSFRIQCNLKT